MISGKKIYYVPGLISALLIPVLFWYLGNRKLNEPIYNIMDFGIPAKYDPKIPIDRQNTLEQIRNWNYQKIEVKPNEARQNSKLYISEIKKLQRDNKKESGIEFILNKENSYDDFISLINDMHISKQEHYGIDLEKTGHFFVVHYYKDSNTEEFAYDCLLCYDVIRNEYKPTVFEDFQFFLKQLPKETFYLIFSFLIFMNISMFSIKERFLN
ncbi:hypothetical protein [Chryseobacterium chendengshani]|uniref:hypothetical protein n=1 Tax=unclassified Chryseobacterium TaxID=2593645 RepID=UPI001C6422F2|nr:MULTISPECIES: hypothetical protein [unclassified Chryseobacterium]MBW7675021.1 hypothetical protein [Chryseobacterium sp. LJ756]MBW8523367.1 hypothetical protein [Chryseobacterium sp. LJ668]QYK15656.1 hypothetical protein K0U91_11350 [Chryseobacterium sp. LJ668]